MTTTDQRWGKRIWLEDDCAVHGEEESVFEAYSKLVETFTDADVETKVEVGDAFYYTMKNGYLLVHSAAKESKIYEPLAKTQNATTQALLTYVRQVQELTEAAHHALLELSKLGIRIPMDEATRLKLEILRETTLEDLVGREHEETLKRVQELEEALEKAYGLVAGAASDLEQKASELNAEMPKEYKKRFRSW